eukprot:m51a1_g13293 hypothetical protein (434) ;mRNA; r:6-2428
MRCDAARIRACGLLFCDVCARDRLAMPDLYKRPQRACFLCYQRLRGLTDDETQQVAAIVPREEEAEERVLSLMSEGAEGRRQQHVVVCPGKYRLYVLAMAPHLYDLLEIRACAGKTDRVELMFLDPFNPRQRIHIFLQTTRMPDVVRMIRQSYERIMPHGPDDSQYPLVTNVPAEFLQPLEPHEEGPAGGFAAAYRAQCNYYGTRWSADVVSHVEQLASEGQRELELGDLPGIEARGTLTAAVDLAPLLSTLYYNHYFTALGLNGVNRRNAVHLLSGVFAYNSVVSRLAVRNVSEGMGDIAGLGQVLALNAACNLQCLDLSDSPLPTSAVASLAAGLSMLRHGLRSLVLRNCCIKPAGVVALVRRGLMRNYAASCCVRTLDLSGNRVGPEGSAALSEWLSPAPSARCSPASPASTLPAAALAARPRRRCWGPS